VQLVYESSIPGSSLALPKVYRLYPEG